MPIAEESCWRHPTILIENAQIVVSLSGLTSVTFGTTTYPTELVTTKLPHDVLTAVALVLDRAGHSNVAAQIACQHLDKSRFLDTPEVFFPVLRAIAKGRRLTEGLRLAEGLLRSETLQWAQFLLMPALMRGGGSLSASEREDLRRLMKLVIERFEALGQKEQAATAHHNLANHLRAQRGPHDRAALRHYRLALKGAVLSLRHHAFQSLLTGALEHRRYGGLEILGDPDVRRLDFQCGVQDFTALYESELREIAALINEQIKHEIADA